MKTSPPARIARHLVDTGGFMLFTMVFQTLYFLADLYWMGRLGKEAVAAVGVAGNLMFVVLALTQMLGVGTTTLVAHAVGRKDPRRRAPRLQPGAVAVARSPGRLFLVVGLALTPAYADAFSADAATAALVRQFLWWFVPAMALQFALVARVVGAARHRRLQAGHDRGAASTVVLNMVLAPVLIFGWGTGVPLGVGRRRGGVARRHRRRASPGSTRYVERPESFLRFRRDEMAPDWPTWKRLLGIGLPAGVEFGLIAVYMGVVYVGEPAVRRRRAGRLRHRPAGGAGRASCRSSRSASPWRRWPGRTSARGSGTACARPSAWRRRWRSAGMLVLVALCQLFPAALIRVFSTDPAVVAVGEEYLRIVSWNFVAGGLVFVTSSMFQAMGNTLPSLVDVGRARAWSSPFRPSSWRAGPASA